LLLPIALCLLASSFDLRAQNAALERARRLFEAGSYAQASQLLDAELTAHPANADAHLLLGQIDALEGKRAEAIQQFTSVLELEPKSAIAYNTLGTALNRFAEFDQARKAFEQAVALDPNLVSARINLAMALAQGGDSASATQQLQAAIGLAPQAQTSATAHYLLAKIYAYEDDQTAQAQPPTPSRAMVELNQALRIRPKYQEAWLALGRLRSEANDQPGALTALERAVACDPKDYDSQYELGSEELAQEKASQAVLHLEAARKLTEHPTLALLYKLDRALRKQGDTARAKQVRAEAQALIAQDAQANQHFQEAQTLDRDGVELEAKGETAKALENYRAALELNPQQDGFRLNYALALCRLNRWQQGIAELNDILQRDPSNADARRALFIAQDKAKANQSAGGPKP
jgi:tetratricopeptide (TPR) repeat protein